MVKATMRSLWCLRGSISSSAGAGARWIRMEIQALQPGDHRACLLPKPAEKQCLNRLRRFRASCKLFLINMASFRLQLIALAIVVFLSAGCNQSEKKSADKPAGKPRIALVMKSLANE